MHRLSVHRRKCIGETDSNSVENRRVSSLTMSKDRCRTFAAGRSGYNATHFCFLSSLGTRVELEVSQIASKKALRGGLGGEQMRRTCVCSFAGCNFAVRRDAVCSRRSICVRDERAGGARGRRFRLLRDVSPRTAETYAKHPLRCGIARRSQPRNRGYISFFSCLRERFPPFRAHLAITELPQADRIAHRGRTSCTRTFIAEYVKEER